MIGMGHKISKAVLTLATGKPIYLQMAINLARSFKRWHQKSDIKFVLATDQRDSLPADLNDIEIVEMLAGQYGIGFSPKLSLDQITPAEKTLFVDADCLCFGSLESVFDRFEGKAVSVIGKSISEGEFFGDVKTLCRSFLLSELPYFVGGIYYLETGELSQRIYQTARALEPRYDEIGLVRLRGRPNEEPLMALSMAIHGASPLLEDGTIKAEPMFYPSHLTVDVLRGKAELRNCSNHPKYSTTWGLTHSKPLIVHFHCSHAERAPYTRECLKLEKIMAAGWIPWIASIYAFWVCSIPQMVIDNFKFIFRPFYRFLFDVRPITASQRIV
jgi:hypothetical protein